MTDTKERLSAVTVKLHWIIAVAMIFLTALGIIMEEFELHQLFDLHISLGVLLLLLVIPRLVWRYRNGWPEPAGNYTRFEHLSGKLVHWLLLLATLLMPLSGILMAIAGGHGLHVFGLTLFPESPDPANPGEVIMLSAPLQQLGEGIHELGADVLPLAIGLHIVGALKHHFVDKDETLRRMLGLAPR